MKIKPIDPVFKPLLEEFLSSPDFQARFATEAKKLGYKGTDPNMIRVALFTPDETNEICFANNDIYEMWIDFQVLKQLYDNGVPRDLDDETKAQLIAECRVILNELHTPKTE